MLGMAQTFCQNLLSLTAQGKVMWLSILEVDKSTTSICALAILTLRLKKLLRPNVLPVANNLIARL